MSDTPKDTLRSAVTGWPSKTARYSSHAAHDMGEWKCPKCGLGPWDCQCLRTSSRQQERDAAVDEPPAVRLPPESPEERHHRELINALNAGFGQIGDMLADILDQLRANVRGGS